MAPNILATTGPIPSSLIITRQLSRNQLLNPISAWRALLGSLCLTQVYWMGAPVGQVPPAPEEVRT